MVRRTALLGALSLIASLTVLANVGEAAFPGTNGKIAYTRPTQCSGGAPTLNQIYVMNADGSNSARITECSTSTASEAPAWSPDGTKIAYTRPTQCSGGAPTRNQIYVMNADGSNPQLISDCSQHVASEVADWQTIPNGPTPPTITSSPSDPSDDPTPEWQFMGASGNTFECELKRGSTVLFAYATCMSPKTYDLTSQIDATYTFHVRQRNGSGQVSPPATDSFTLDRTPAPPSAAASLESVNPIAGGQHYLYFTVRNTGTSTINAIDFDPTGTQTAVDGESLDWTYSTSGPGGRFRAGSLTPGQTKEFVLVGDYPARTSDGAAAWSVKVSTDSGATVTPATSESPGLSSQVRVLEVESVEVSGPEGATDGTATAGQRIDVTARVVNHSSQNMLVVASIATPEDTLVSDAPSQTIPAGASADFTFGVRLGTQGTREFKVDVSASGADGVEEYSDELTVEPRPQAQQQSGAMSPSMSTGAQPSTLSLALSKTTGPSLTLTTETVLSLVRLGGTEAFTSQLVGPVELAAGSDLVALKLARETAVTMPDGMYVGSLRLVGIDASGETFDEVIPTDSFVVDSSVPKLGLSLMGPAGQIDDSGRPVVKPGDLVSFTGLAFLDGSMTVPDPAAELVDCRAVLLDKTGVIALGSSQLTTSTCSLDGGAIAGLYTLSSLPAGTKFMRVDVTVRRLGSASTPRPQSTDLLAVDTGVPLVRAATKMCQGVSCLPTSIVKVRFSEPVKGHLSAADFGVAGASVQQLTSTCSATTWCSDVDLTVSPSLTFGQAPLVTYQPTTSALRPSDGSGQTMQSSSASAKGIDESPGEEAMRDCDSRGEAIDTINDDGSWTCTKVSPEPQMPTSAMGPLEIPAAPCFSDGGSTTNVYRIKAVYAYYEEAVPRPDQGRTKALPVIRRALSRADYWLNNSSGENQHFRFHCRNKEAPTVTSVEISDNPRHPSRSEFLNSLRNNLRSSHQNMLYLVFLDVTGLRGTPPCGKGDGEYAFDEQGGIEDSPLSTNPNNGGDPQYPAVCWNPDFHQEHPDRSKRNMAHGTLHETLHTMGAVQYSAPFDTGGPGSLGTSDLHHTYEEEDIMAKEFDDGSYYDGLDGQRGTADDRSNIPRADCSDRWLVDCHNDDYYNPVGGRIIGAGGREIWNIACSWWLTPVPCRYQ